MSNDMSNAAASRDTQMEAVAASMADLTISYGHNAMDTPAPRDTGLELALQNFQMGDSIPKTTATQQERKEKMAPQSRKPASASTSTFVVSTTRKQSSSSALARGRNVSAVE